MKSLLSRSPILLAVAAACMGVLAPAHASITVSTWANCPVFATAKFNYSYTYQSPAMAEWQFSLVQQVVTNGGSYINGSGAPNYGFVSYRYDFDLPEITYQAMGIHSGDDGHAHYTVYTPASTCDTSKYYVYQEPPKPSAGFVAAADPSKAAVAADVANMPAQAMVRVASAASVMPLAQYTQQRRSWELLAPQAAAEGVAALLSDTKHPSFAKALSDHREKLTFVAAQLASTELGKLTVTKSLPAGTFGDSGWSGYTRIYQTARSEWVMVEELDLQALHANVVILRDAINADVNGNPALLRTARAGGSQLTALTWIANNRRYALKTNAADANAGDRLLAIARGLY